ncbi:MAG TPA: hypothetical protein VFE86_09940, partial [Ilumatobacteraceae bacterium]|nr:hypothetical protein [Ilumatobacteraceae bacterium]
MRHCERLREHWDEGHRVAGELDDPTTTSGERHLAAAESIDQYRRAAARAEGRPGELPQHRRPQQQLVQARPVEPQDGHRWATVEQRPAKVPQQRP